MQRRAKSFPNPREQPPEAAVRYPSFQYVRRSLMLGRFECLDCYFQGALSPDGRCARCDSNAVYAHEIYFENNRIRRTHGLRLVHSEGGNGFLAAQNLGVLTVAGSTLTRGA